MDAIVLCGGRGTRLASEISNCPKPLAVVGEIPFMDHLLTFLEGFSPLQRVVLATGHLAEQFHDRYGDGFGRLKVAFSQEIKALGTAGAAFNALRGLQIRQPCLILNGDSYCPLDLDAMVRARKQPGLVVGLATVEDSSRFGTIQLQGSRISNFTEKTGLNVPGVINAGIYFADPSVFLPWMHLEGVVSMEEEVLPDLCQQGLLQGFLSDVPFLDIGIPADYRRAAQFLMSHGAARVLPTRQE